jgi:hypothetical protein
VVHVNKILLIALVFASLWVIGIARGEVGMGMAPSLINMTLVPGETHTTNLILYNPYNVSYYAFLRVMCLNCNRNITFMGYNIAEIREDASQFIEIRQLNLFLKNGTSVREGSNVFPIIRSPKFVSENVRIGILGGVPFELKVPILGQKRLYGQIIATSDGLGTNLSIAIDWILDINGFPVAYLIMYLILGVFIATLILRWKLGR